MVTPLLMLSAFPVLVNALVQAAVVVGLGWLALRVAR